MNKQRNQSSVPRQITTPKLQYSYSPYPSIPKSPFTPFQYHFNPIHQPQFPSGFQLYPKSEEQPGLTQNYHSDDIYRWMIDLIVENVEYSQEVLLSQLKIKKQCKPPMQEAFKILLKKFKKLRKTKEEMTKYCMRKAFKFLGQKMRNQGHMQRGQNDFNLRYYFPENRSQDWLSIPFRKNSIEKTMNTSFLKKIFSSPQFIDDYRDFVNTFKNLAKEDNQRKINYLSQIVQEAITQSNVSKIQSVKRLPWTLPMLRKTEQLAFKLMQYRPGHMRQMPEPSFQFEGGSLKIQQNIQHEGIDDEHYQQFCPGSPNFQSHDGYCHS